MQVLELLEEHKSVVETEFALIGMRVAAPHTAEFGKLVNEVRSSFDQRRGELPNQVAPSVGVGFTPLMPRRPAQEIHTYYVGAIVERVDFVPKGMEGLVLPEQRYVAYKWQGADPYPDLNRWIDDQGFKVNLGSGYVIELYAQGKPVVILTAIEG